MAQTIPADNVREDLERVIDELDRVPLKTEYDEHGAYSADTLVKKFDDTGKSYHQAVQNLGYEPPEFDEHNVPDGVVTDEVDRLVDELDLSDSVRDTAHSLVTQWTTITNLSASRVEPAAAAAIVLACRIHEVPYSVRDVAAVDDDISRKIATRIKGTMARELSSEYGIEVRPNRPEDYIDRFVSESGVSHQIAETARAIIATAREGDEMHFSGRSPTSSAAAAIWLAAQYTSDSISQVRISNIANTTAVTIRNNADALRNAVAEAGTTIEDVCREPQAET